MHRGAELPAFALSGGDLALITTVSGAVTLYAIGTARLWREAGVGHGIRRWEAGAYLAGILILVAVLLPPLDAWADILFSAHMSQHEALMILAAPLIVLGRPFVAAAWALRGSPSLAIRPIARGWRLLTHPLFILLVHGGVLWLLHAPRLFEAALADERLHALQHILFFGTAVLFWWALLRGRYGRVGYGVAVLYVFTTAVHSSLLGLLVTLARTPWYPSHAARTEALGGDAVADQTLAGLLMWIPMGVILTAVGLGLFAAWLGESERRARRGELRG